MLRPEREDGSSEGLRPAIVIDDPGRNSAVRAQQREFDSPIFRTEWPKRLYAIKGIAERGKSEVPVYGA